MTDNTPGPGDWREQRDREREERREHGWGGPWIGGVILIVLGVVFLLQNFGWQLPKNWWAAFILIPAAGSLMAARRNYEANGGRLTGGVIGPGVAGIVFVVMAVALFLGVEWGAFWPIILILVGGGIMARTMWRG
jgi:hypothetical protein